MTENKTDLKQLAIDVFEGRVYTSADSMEPFLLIKLMDKGAMMDFLARDPGLIYEYMEKAGPLQCNGRPMFFSFQFITRADMPEFIEHIERLENERNAFLNQSEANVIGSME